MSPFVQVLTIAIVTTVACISVALGLEKGIKRLSNFNIAMAIGLLIFILVTGPTLFLLKGTVESLGVYLATLPELALWNNVFPANDDLAGWQNTWTVFYWAWTITWAPFVGIFVARISRGRTIKEFCLTVLMVPAGVSTIWFAIFGGTAITLEREGNSIWGDGTAENQLFNLLHQLPGGTITSFLAVILLGTFFITSADSASTVMGSLSQNGRSDASPWVSASWGVITALIGMTLLVAGGNDALSNLQNVTIVAASPFLVVLVALMFATWKGLREDVIYLEQREHREFQKKLARERRLMREHEARVVERERRRRAFGLQRRD